MIMRRLLACVFAILLSSCGEFDTEGMFNRHVIASRPGDVRALRGGKVSCMHCPMYFAFDADQRLVSKIVSAHHLQQVVGLLEDIQQIEDIVKRDASWWALATPEKGDKVYWIQYKPKQAESDPAFRLLVVRGEKLFFITSGHFDRANFSSQE